jgi:chondroitin 4-sulfotransferase 11
MGAINLKDRNMTYIHVPRTGGQSVREFLLKEKDAKIMSLGKRDINTKHPDIWTTKNHFGDLGYTFCTVRNPYDRLVSMFAHLKRVDRNMPAKTDFSKFVFEYADYDTFMKPISSWFNNGDIDYIMRFENLSNDFEVIKKKLDANRGLIHKNAASHNNYKSYYTDEIKEFVTEKFKEDIERFNYSFE